MDCTNVRRHLGRLGPAEPDPAVARAVLEHLTGCPACRRAWREIDPLAASGAFGPVAPTPPTALAARITAAVALRPLPRSRPRWPWQAALGAVGVVALWLGSDRLLPLLWAALYAAVTATAEAGRLGWLVVRSASVLPPGLAPAAATLIVVAEAVLLRGGMEARTR